MQILVWFGFNAKMQKMQVTVMLTQDGVILGCNTKVLNADHCFVIYFNVASTCIK